MMNRSASLPLDRLAPNLALAAAEEALDAWRPVGAVAGDWLRRVAAARPAGADLASGEARLVAWAAE